MNGPDHDSIGPDSHAGEAGPRFGHRKSVWLARLGACDSSGHRFGRPWGRDRSALTWRNPRLLSASHSSTVPTTAAVTARPKPTSHTSEQTARLVANQRLPPRP